MSILRRLLVPPSITATMIATIAAGQGFTEVRKHFVAREDGGGIRVTATEIVQLTPEHDTNVVVLEADRGTLLVMTRERDYQHQDGSYEIRDPKRKAFIRSSVQFPFAAHTREETIAEARGKPGGRSIALKLTIETPGIVLSMTEDEWKDHGKAREWRTQIRESLDPVFLESLERLRAVFRADPRLQAFHDVLLEYVFHGGHCDDGAARIAVEPAPPDCEFDAAAGFPCREKQKERIAKAAKESRLIEVY